MHELKVFICFFYVFCATFTNAVSTANLIQGLPEAWDGDKFQKFPCRSRNIPKWLNGYFLVQTCASYGNLNGPLGQKMTHMFDAIGAVASVELHDGSVGFSARYYPARPYKIWNFYERDMTKSTVAWPTFATPFNTTSAAMWNQITNDRSFRTHPNVDFWKIGSTVLGATEFVHVGMQMNVSSLSNMKGYEFKDNDPLFRYASSMIPLAMPVHERMETDGSIFACTAAIDRSKNKTYQVIFKVKPDGTRTVEGVYDHGTYDLTKCTSDGRYNGNKKLLAGYMHSITSTKQYVILPVTSMVYNPCKLNNIFNRSSDLPADLQMNPSVTEFAENVPVRFLVFDKSRKIFLTAQPLESFPSLFVTHQFNAYEDDDGTIVADMLGTEDGAYDSLTPDSILKKKGLSTNRNRSFRYRINLKTNVVDKSDILPTDYPDVIEFPSYNRDYMEKKYKYGYVLTKPYYLGGKILKLDLDQKKIVGEFSAPGANKEWSVFKEPWFVPRPSSVDEDDGVVLVLAGNLLTNTTNFYALDGKSFQLVGDADIPTFIPFGFHNRFYSVDELHISRS